MNRRTKGLLLAGGLVVVAAAAAVVVLPTALARAVDPHNYCETGFSRLVDCTSHWTSTTTSQSSPIFTTPGATSAATPTSPETSRPSYTETTSWAFARCSEKEIIRRWLCAVPAAGPAQAASDDVVTGLPRPKPWFVTTAKKTPSIESLHIETPLALAAALDFYRTALGKRGWTENGDPLVGQDHAMIAFTTTRGPALLRLIHQDDRTIADLSLRNAAAANDGVLSRQGHAKLMVGNATDDDAVITINGRTIELAARAGQKLKTADSPEIDLPPGKFRVTLKVAGGKVQNREYEVAAGETWGLLAGPDGIALAVHLD